jgi:hypothetical protein
MQSSDLAVGADQLDVNRDGVVDARDLELYLQLYSEAAEAGPEIQGLDINGDGAIFDPGDVDRLLEIKRAHEKLIDPVSGFAIVDETSRQWFVGGVHASDETGDGSQERPYATFRKLHDVMYFGGYRHEGGIINLMPGPDGVLTCGRIGGEYGDIRIGGNPGDGWLSPLVIRTDPRWSEDPANAGLRSRASVPFDPGQSGILFAGDCDGYVQLLGLRFGDEVCRGSRGGWQYAHVAANHSGAIWIEDCEMRGGRHCISLGGRPPSSGGEGMGTCFIRRNILRENRPRVEDQTTLEGDEGGHCQGIGYSWVRGCIVEENVFYRNGRREAREWTAPQGNGTIFNHANYVNPNCSDIIFRGNLVVEPSASAAQFRGGLGHKVLGNVIVDAPTGIGLGHDLAPWPEYGLRAFQCVGNAVLGSAMIHRGFVNGQERTNAPGWGLVSHRLRGGVVSHNLLWGNQDQLAKFGLLREAGKVSETALFYRNVVGGYGTNRAMVPAAGEYLIENQFGAFAGVTLHLPGLVDVATRLSRGAKTWSNLTHGVTHLRDQIQTALEATQDLGSGR